MARPAINTIHLNEHLGLSECHPDSECRTVNWWLYDTRAYGGMNVAVRAKTRDEAFVAAIEFWAKRALEAERKHAQIKDRVDAFVNQFTDDPDDDDDD